MQKHKIVEKKEYTDILICEGIINSDVEKIYFPNGNTKIVFEIKTDKGNVCDCVYWHNINLEKGQTVTMKGRLKDKVFLVWSLMKHRGDV